MTEFFKAGSQSKINTVLLRFFILSTLIIVFATWNIQHSSKPMFLLQQGQLSFGSVKDELVKDDKIQPVKDDKIQPAKDDKIQPVKDDKTEKELIAIGAGAMAALAVPLLIAEAPAITVVGIGVAVWLVVRMSFNAIF